MGNTILLFNFIITVDFRLISSRGKSIPSDFTNFYKLYCIIN